MGVISQIALKNTYNKQDLDILCNLSVNDFYILFTKEKGTTRNSYIDCCLNFERHSNPTEKEKQIANNAKEALKKIGRESILKQRKVEALGISIETD